MTHKRSGYILVLTLLILSIIVMTITQLYRQGTLQLFYNRTSIEREKAKQLALGGIQIAFAQMSLPEEENKKEEKKVAEQKPDQEEKKKDPNLEFFQKIVPKLNQLQSFELEKEVDGIDGRVEICITSEDGKLDINEIWDFGKKEFIGGEKNKKIVAAYFASLGKLIKKDLFSSFEKFLKQRQYKLQDVSELLQSDDFQKQFRANIFYEPPAKTEKREQQMVFLTDIFTVSSHQKTLNPWLLSDSVSAIFGLEGSSFRRTKKNEIEELLKNAKSVSGDLKTVWEKYLSKLYGKELSAVPKNLVPLLGSPLSFSNFTVLSYGTVGNVTQKVAALIERLGRSEFLVRKLYWL